MVGIDDWVPDKRSLGDNICVKSRKILKNTKNHFESCFVYFYQINCNNNKELCCIHFPNCENIHIFAATIIECETEGEEHG